ncbi:MAG TPA: hypothetical protein VNN73_04930 [Blastocatellia bacterium]|nr:hypothetical protein [Blastocatellia bacterium]
MLRKTIAFCLLLCTVACHARQAPVEDAQKAAALFIQRLNAGEFEKIYDDAAKGLKDRGHDEVVKSLKEAASKGVIREYSLISMELPASGKQRMANPVYAAVSDSWRGNLKLKFIDEDGEWKLIGFER